MKKYLYILMLLLCAALMFAVTPVAWPSADHTITIAQGDSLAEIQTKLQNAINDAANGGSVTINGSIDGVNETLNLTIPANKTVIWQAAISGNYAHPLIKLNGAGTFKVAPEALITARYLGGCAINIADNGSVDVCGGTISAETYGILSEKGNVAVSNGIINCNDTLGRAISVGSGNVKISGGVVTATGNASYAIAIDSGKVEISGSGRVMADMDSSSAICANTGSITVSGGTITAPRRYGAVIYSEYGNVTVNGGTISSIGDGAVAIAVINGTAAISSGTISAAQAVSTDSGSVAVTGGRFECQDYVIGISDYGVAAYLHGVCDNTFNIASTIKNGVVHKRGIIVEVDSLSIPASRNNTSEGLTVTDGAGIAKWNTAGPIPIVEFTLADNSKKSLGWGYLAETPTSSGLIAAPIAATVLLNGESVAFDAYNIEGNNYFKLRDLAFMLNGTAKQFAVSWDGAENAIYLASDAAYTTIGGEMATKGIADKTVTPINSKIYLDGREVQFTAYNIDGNNYFKLRNIGETFDFGVDWAAAKNTIVIDTSKGYTPE